MPQHFQMQKKTPHTTLFPPKPRPTQPNPTPIYPCSSSGEAPAHRSSPSCQTPIFSAEVQLFHLAQASGLGPLPREVHHVVVFYVTCFSGHFSHKQLDLSGSGTV